MAQLIDLGKIRFNWAGTYDPATEYSYNDLVKYGPNLYAYTASVTSTGVLPTDETKWSLVTEGIFYKGLYTSGAKYYRNDIVIDGTNTYITLTEHTASSNVAAGNTKLEIIAQGQAGLPNQTGKANYALTSDGTSTLWSKTLKLDKSYFGTSQGSSAYDFETSAGLTNVASIFKTNASDFSQLVMVNGTNASAASTDFIAYTADGNNSDGWIDMGITSRTFDTANFGITGPHDGYIFMSAPRGTIFEVLKKKIIGTTATVTTGAAHGYSVGNKVNLEGVGTDFDGTRTITGVTSTTFGFATTASPFSEVNLSPSGSVHKPYGNGNLVLATDWTGLSNSIIFAAGGYDSGTTQMTIIPNQSVAIAISTAATSATSGALTVAGGVGITGSTWTNGNLYVGGILYSGNNTALSWGQNNLLTGIAAVVEVTSGNDSYGQFAFHNTNSSSSVDFIAYPNNGDDSHGWIDMGMTGSTFNSATYGITGPNDGYIFVDAPVGTSGYGNLVLATGAQGTRNRIVFAAGGFASGHTQMEIIPDTSVKINIATPSTSATTGALVVTGGVGITGDVNIAGNITFGGSGTNVSTANLAVNAPLVFTGTGSIVGTNDLGLVTEGKYTVTNIPVATVVNKQLSTNVATLITKTDHKFLVGDSVVIASIDATFNGTYSITAVPSTTSFSYAKTNVDVASARIGDQTFSINNKALVSNIAILQTSASHTYTVGQTVVVTGVDSTFNGTYTISATTANTFSYAKTYTNVTSAAVSPVGTAVVNTSASTATVSAATRTRYSALTKRNTDGVWNLISNISTIPTTSINYSQNTYGNGVDVVYDQYKLGGLTIQGSGSLYGAPYGSLTFIGDISSPAWTTTGIRHVGSGASTLTDTTSSGTVAAAYTNTFNSNVTIAASTTTTYTDYVNSYFGSPVAGTNVTISNPWSIMTVGAVKVGTGLTVGGNTTLVGSLVGGSASDITINSNKFNVTAANGNTAIAGTLAVTGATTNTGLINANGGLTVASGQTLTSSGTLTVTGGAAFSGTTDMQELRETVVDVTLASNVGTLDWSAGNIYYVGTAPTGNMTFNVTNVPTDASKIMTINVFVVQGSTGYIPTTFNIAGSGQTIRWPGGTAPTGTSTAGKIDIFSFTMQRTSGGSWIVYGTSSTNY